MGRRPAAWTHGSVAKRSRRPTPARLPVPVGSDRADVAGRTLADRAITSVSEMPVVLAHWSRSRFPGSQAVEIAQKQPRRRRVLRLPLRRRRAVANRGASCRRQTAGPSPERYRSSAPSHFRCWSSRRLLASQLVAHRANAAAGPGPGSPGPRSRPTNAKQPTGVAARRANCRDALSATSCPSSSRSTLRLGARPEVVSYLAVSESGRA
jgi:hypothetical protein